MRNSRFVIHVKWVRAVWNGAAVAGVGGRAVVPCNLPRHIGERLLQYMNLVQTQFRLSALHIFSGRPYSKVYILCQENHKGVCECCVSL